MDNKKKIIIIVAVVLCVIITAGSIFIFSDILKSSTPPSNTPETETPSKPKLTPTLSVPDSLQVDAGQTIQFSYTATNASGYNITITIANTSIAIINNNIILGKTSGTTQICTTINCTPAVTKQTTLTVNAVVTNITHRYLNSTLTNATSFYVGNTYYLEVTENHLVSNTPTIEYDENYISNFAFYSKNERTYLFKFVIASHGTFHFKYTSKKFSAETNDICAYVYPNNFDVSFSVPAQNDTINLYLFNQAHSSLANADGYFNSVTITTQVTPNSNDSLVITCSNSNIASLNNQTLTAISCGSCTLTVTSEVSGISKNYTIVVSQVPITHIVFNGTPHSLNSNINLVLKLNEPSEFVFNVLPCYALHTLSFEHSNDVDISNNSITLLSATPQIVTAKLNNVDALSIAVSAEPSYKINSSVFRSNCSYTYTNNTLAIALSPDGYVVLQLEIFDLNTNSTHSSQELYINISNKNILNTSDTSNQVKNNLVTLELLTAGSTTLTVYNSTLNISITIQVTITP